MKGRLRDLKVAVHHSAYCLGCCWALMVLFIAFGIMNVWTMLGLAAVVVNEKVLRRASPSRRSGSDRASGLGADRLTER